MIDNNRRLLSVSEMMFGDKEDSSVKLQDIDVYKLIPYRNHPFKMYQGERYENLKQSIKELGVLTPIIVRPDKESDGHYEILAGHNRTMAAKDVGIKEIASIVKEDLSEDEALLIVTESNLAQRSFNDMLPSEKAKVLKCHYNALNNQGIRKGFLEQINAEIKTLSNTDEIRAEGTLSPAGTEAGIRASALEYGLNKNTVARYLRIDILIDDLKELADNDRLSVRAAVQLSYLTEEHQQYIADIMNEDNKVKLDEKKAKDMHKLEDKNSLDEVAIEEIVSGIKQVKQTGRPKAYKVSASIISKYFNDSDNKKHIESVIDEALSEYFSKN